MILGVLRRYEEALAASDRAFELEPELSLAHDYRARALGGLGRYAEAAAACDRALQLEPELADAYYNRACAYSRLHKREEALRDLKRAIELDEKHRQRAKTDEDFESLRGDAEFRKLVGLEEGEAE